MSLVLAKDLYPELVGQDYFYGPCNYQPIIDSFGSVAVQVDDRDYQGDSRVLYDDGGRIGLLIFGWGSCSGCDALQACGTLGEVDELIAHLSAKVQWFDSRESALSYFEGKDWEVEYSWHADETKEFVAKAVEYLKA